MYQLGAFKPVVLLGFMSQLVFSTRIQNLARRQDTVMANFDLLGSDADCFDFSFNSNTFSATCVSDAGIPVSTSINLDACITNNNGNMVYKSE
jgi:hypothetical protein